MKRILIALALVVGMTGMAWGANVEPTAVNNGYSWDLVSTAITASGDSNILIGRNDCKTYTAFITTSGTTNMTAAFKIDDGTASYATVKTYTLSTDVTRGYTWNFNTQKMYVTFTITGGQVDDLVVTCTK